MANELIGSIFVETSGMRPLGVIEADSFISDISGILSEEEYERMKVTFAYDAELGEIIPGTGGMRKFRWQTAGRGKRGGARVIYFYNGPEIPLVLISAYSKSEKVNITKKEKQELYKLACRLKKHFRSD